MKKLGLIIVIAIAVIFLIGYGVIENRNQKRKDINILAASLLATVIAYSGEDEKIFAEGFESSAFELLDGILIDKGLYYQAKELGAEVIDDTDWILSIYTTALQYDDMCSFLRSRNTTGAGYDDFCVNVEKATKLMKQKINGDNSILFKKKVLWFYY